MGYYVIKGVSRKQNRPCVRVPARMRRQRPDGDAIHQAVCTRNR